jgi:Rad3-related DNA helicase
MLVPANATPHSVGIPYDSWRPNQLDTINWLRTTQFTQQGLPIVKITEQSTGSGKSPTAMAINDGDDRNYQVIVLTHTRNLQHQYEGIFKDCMIHKGKSNYPCTNTDNPHEKPNADDCIFMGRLRQCPEYPCPYYASRNASRGATRLSLNYAYWFAMKDIYAPYYLMLDEAHSLSDLVLEHVGATIGEYERARWQLPEFPEIIEPAMALFTDQPAAPQAALDWLMVAQQKMAHWSEHFQCQISKLEGAAQIEAMTNARVAERTAKKYATTLDGLAAQPGEHWFIRTGMDFARRRGIPENALVIKPLTARFDFAKFFLASENRWLDETRVAMMSATIGNVEVFAEELGIHPYDARVVPSMWKPEQRPVHILDAPSMGRKSVMKDDKAFDKQADVIAKAIKEQPKEWAGLILVSRKTEVLALAERLRKRGLGKRIYPMVAEDLSYVPTEQQVIEWEARKEKIPNSIGISASLFTGYDGRFERILIVAKIPFAHLGDPYEKARMAFSQRTFLWRAACTLEQGLGRTRRGYPDDYEINGQHNGFVALADGNYDRIKGYLSQGLLDSLIGG